MKFESPTPILRMFDEHKAREFYIEYLEFQVDWEHRFAANMPLYMQVSKGNCVLHLSEHHGDCSPGAALRIETPDIVQYHQLLKKKKYKNANPGMESQPWASNEMCIADPFGNRLIFFSPLDQ
ncbi:glyoxalase superfamily protein [Pontibacter sp. MBLB2868]|uniref:glyoxalase superfamily protein n=1 Tax=Pontibacter sp. MBLB2868 TaxID=3451555 RepID=UPI003F754363